MVWLYHDFFIWVQFMSYLFVGLGNPGDQYLLTRHNIGFILMDALFHFYSFPSFKNKFKGSISQGKINTFDCILLKPTTYMNLSGESVQALLSFYKIPLDQVIVFHDDLDLEPFDVRIKKGGSSGGHNGLKSITQHIGNDYWRFRFGIGHPGIKDMVSQYVLSPFSKDEQQKLPDFLELFCKKITTSLPPKEQKNF